MAIYGYARVSSKDQDVAIQREMLLNAGCEAVHEEKVSGTSRVGRTKLELLLGLMESGDTLVVTRIDRLARSLRDLQNIVHDLKQRGIALKATEQPIDTSTAAGKCFLDMLGVFAEFETAIRRERQLEGVKRAKAEGAYKGRAPSIDRRKLAHLRAQGLGATEIARAMGVDRTSIYRIMKESKASLAS
jgi:DNA invertase Pin-like site-specific DNA recombinase